MLPETILRFKKKALLLEKDSINSIFMQKLCMPDKKLLQDFDRIKDDAEEILWTDKPKFVPYIITTLSLGAGVLIFVGFSYSIARNSFIENGRNDNIFLLFLLLPFVFFLFNFLSKLFSYSNTRYAYSSRRVMIRSGFIGTDFKIIDYDKISDIQVTVNFVERLFNVGTIRFYSGRTESDEGTIVKVYDRWEAIANPYEVFKQLKTVTVDIKTDYNYPNALRPGTNPGYKTKYDPEKK